MCLVHTAPPSDRSWGLLARDSQSARQTFPTSIGTRHRPESHRRSAAQINISA
jgi:hypothetical protein